LLTFKRRIQASGPRIQGDAPLCVMVLMDGWELKPSDDMNAGTSDK